MSEWCRLRLRVFASVLFDDFSRATGHCRLLSLWSGRAAGRAGGVCVCEAVRGLVRREPAPVAGQVSRRGASGVSCLTCPKRGVHDAGLLRADAGARGRAVDQLSRRLVRGAQPAAGDAVLLLLSRHDAAGVCGGALFLLFLRGGRRGLHGAALPGRPQVFGRLYGGLRGAGGAGVCAARVAGDGAQGGAGAAGRGRVCRQFHGGVHGAAGAGGVVHVLGLWPVVARHQLSQGPPAGQRRRGRGPGARDCHCSRAAALSAQQEADGALVAARRGQRGAGGAAAAQGARAAPAAGAAGPHRPLL